MQAYFDLAHKYGAWAMNGIAAGACAAIPRFVEMGLDILDVVQVDAAGMSIGELHRYFPRQDRPARHDERAVNTAVRQPGRRASRGGGAPGALRGRWIDHRPDARVPKPLTPVENVVEMYR